MSSRTPIIDSHQAGQPHQHYDVVFHIGAPKTGASAIQKFLLENRQALKSLGFYYPEHALDENGVSGGHTGFGLKIKKENCPKQNTNPGGQFVRGQRPLPRVSCFMESSIIRGSPVSPA
jgi:hypothetical protein